MQTAITFNDIPAVLLEMRQQMSEVKSLVENLTRERYDSAGAEKLVFGIFKKNELVALSDPRLWSLPSSPFGSQREAYYAKDKGCPFCRPAKERKYYIKAKNLESWLTEWSCSSPKNLNSYVRR